MKKLIKPIFIFSLPRAGSTLLQRVLGTSEDIATTAEPWILLPLMFMTKEKGELSQYSHFSSSLAVNEFINNMQGAEEAYNLELNSFVRSLYEKHSNNQEYFLDKTPRYYEIIDDIAKVFPEAKFIFLFRNPVHIYASIIKTWGNNTFKNLHNNLRDLLKGPELLSKGYEKFKDRSIAIKYEYFITNPEEEVERLFKYLEIEEPKEALSGFSDTKLKGIMGDPTGRKEYQSVSTAPLSKWRNTFSTLFRKRVITKYVKSLDENVLEIQGYSKSAIISEISTLPNSIRGILKDYISYSYSRLISRFSLHLVFGKSYRWIKGNNLK